MVFNLTGIFYKLELFQLMLNWAKTI